MDGSRQHKQAQCGHCSVTCWTPARQGLARNKQRVRILAVVVSGSRAVTTAQGGDHVLATFTKADVTISSTTTQTTRVRSWASWHQVRRRHRSSRRHKSRTPWQSIRKVRARARAQRHPLHPHRLHPHRPRLKHKRRRRKRQRPRGNASTPVRNGPASSWRPRRRSRASCSRKKRAAVRNCSSSMGAGSAESHFARNDTELRPFVPGAGTSSLVLQGTTPMPTRLSTIPGTLRR